MTESKKKRVISALIVGAVLLLIVLLAVMTYQLFAIKIRNEKLEEYNAKVAEFEQLIASGEDTVKARQTYEWIVLRAKELGLVPPESDILDS